MPTYELLPSFLRDLQRLSPVQREALRTAIARFAEDLSRNHFRPGLRVKGVRGAEGIFEMTWAPDGRATFQYGPSRSKGEPHVIWRRVGTHDVLGRP